MSEKEREKKRKQKAVISAMKSTSLQNVSVMLHRSKVRKMNRKMNRKMDRNLKNVPIPLSSMSSLSPSPEEEGVAEPILNAKEGEGLSDIVMNANAANHVLMDDIIDDIEDEGEGTETVDYEAGH